MGNGSQYNARWESILTTWRELNQNRAIMKVDAFWEGEGCFKRKDGKNFNLGCILNGRNEFAILTVEPNEVVKPYHRRAPLCLSDDSVTFFLEGCVKEIKQLDSGLYIVSNKIAA
jgi:putative SOS response-associated peptidase YedK